MAKSLKATGQLYNFYRIFLQLLPVSLPIPAPVLLSSDG